MTQASAKRVPRKRASLLDLIRAPEASAEEPGLRQVLAALSEPAAVVSVEGRVVEANAPWRELVGASNRLPAGSSLYPALAAALRGEPGEGRLRAG